MASLLSSGVEMKCGAAAVNLLRNHGLDTETLILELEVHADRSMEARLTGLPVDESGLAVDQRKSEVMSQLDLVFGPSDDVPKAIVARQLLPLVGLWEKRLPSGPIKLHGAVVLGFLAALEGNQNTSVATYVDAESHMTSAKIVRFSLSSKDPSQRKHRSPGIAIFRHTLEQEGIARADDKEKVSLESALIRGNIDDFLKEHEVDMRLYRGILDIPTEEQDWGATEVEEQHPAVPVAAGTKRRADDDLDNAPKKARLNESSLSASPAETADTVTAPMDHAIIASMSSKAVYTSDDKVKHSGVLRLAPDGSRLLFMAEEVSHFDVPVKDITSFEKSKKFPVMLINVADRKLHIRLSDEETAMQDLETLLEHLPKLRDFYQEAAALPTVTPGQTSSRKRKADDQEKATTKKTKTGNEQFIPPSDDAQQSRPTKRKSKFSPKSQKQQKTQQPTPTPSVTSAVTPDRDDTSPAASTSEAPAYEDGTFVLTAFKDDERFLSWWSITPGAPGRLDISVSDILKVGKKDPARPSSVAFNKKQPLWISVNLREPNNAKFFFFSFTDKKKAKKALETYEMLQNLLHGQPMPQTSATPLQTTIANHEVIDLTCDDETASQGTYHHSTQQPDHRAQGQNKINSTPQKKVDPAIFLREAIESAPRWGRQKIGNKDELLSFCKEHAVHYLTRGVSIDGKEWRYAQYDLQNIVKLYVEDHPLGGSETEGCSTAAPSAELMVRHIEHGVKDFVGIFDSRLRAFILEHGMEEAQLQCRKELVAACHKVLQSKYSQLLASIEKKDDEEEHPFAHQTRRLGLARKFRECYKRWGYCHWRHEDMTVGVFREFLQGCGEPYSDSVRNMKGEDLQKRIVSFLKDKPHFGPLEE